MPRLNKEDERNLKRILEEHRICLMKQKVKFRNKPHLSKEIFAELNQLNDLSNKLDKSG